MTKPTKEFDIDELIEHQKLLSKKKDLDLHRSETLGTDPSTSAETVSSHSFRDSSKGRFDIESGAKGPELVIEWSNVKCTYPAKTAGSEAKTTLVNSSGYLQTREVTAIMGPRYVLIVP